MIREKSNHIEKGQLFHKLTKPKVCSSKILVKLIDKSQVY